ncbi:MAG: Holliday junction resolvase RuvX [Phycisphaeraceae bacterium]|nr:MAG: Holliday junction resolvase RuvX [Phycisphaeraceae bacterium]
MTRAVGIDLGDKRTGLALGDSVTQIASPSGVLEVPIDERGGEALLDAIAAALDELVGSGPADLVVGLPLNMDGSEGPRAKLVRTFAARIATRTGREVYLHDERRSSLAADERMARTGLTHKQKKARRDAIAAAAILQDYLERGPSENPV